jgi:hypothetical protein
MMPFRSHDKDINVIGPVGLAFSIDFDDVPHDLVRPAAEKMLRILNKYWGTET